MMMNSFLMRDFTKTGKESNGSLRSQCSRRSAGVLRAESIRRPYDRGEVAQRPLSCCVTFLGTMMNRISIDLINALVIKANRWLFRGTLRTPCSWRGSARSINFFDGSLTVCFLFDSSSWADVFETLLHLDNSISGPANDEPESDSCPESSSRPLRKTCFLEVSLSEVSANFSSAHQ